MKIVIVGPGALGSLIAGFLVHKTKDEVWLLDKYEDRAERLRRSGVTVETAGGAVHEKLSATSDPSAIGIADLVIVCVKSYSTEDACRGIKAMVGDKTRVLSLQNGLGNIQVLNDHFGAERVIAGVTNHGATLLEAGRVRHAGKGETVIGTADGRVLGEIRNVATVLSKAGFDTKISKDIDSVIWSKLVVNVGVNAVTALTSRRNGALLESSEARSVMRAAVQEAVKVAKRKRVKLTYDDAFQKVETVCKATAENISSMLQDVMNKKRTEVDYINGAIVRQGKALGIPTPVNETLTDLLRAVETGYATAARINSEERRAK